jgi:hypothetical protein
VVVVAGAVVAGGEVAVRAGAVVTLPLQDGNTTNVIISAMATISVCFMFLPQNLYQAMKALHVYCI